MSTAPPTTAPAPARPTAPGPAVRGKWVVGRASPGQPGQRPAAPLPGPAVARQTPPDRFGSLGRAPEVLALSSVGFLVVAVGYAVGRTGVGGVGHAAALVAYWVGQVLVFTPVVSRLFARRLAGAPEAGLLVIGLATIQYLLKWAYSPDQLKFPDELLHWAATTQLVKTGRLFQTDLGLPVATHFPGLEEMGAAVTSLTGLPVTASALLVAGVAHLVFVGALFILVVRAGGTPRLAGLSCVIYATALHYLFFDSMYLYQIAGLPFLLLALWASRSWRIRDRKTWPFGVVGLAAIAVTTVSHHVTAMVLVAALTLAALVELVAGRRRAADPGAPAVAAAPTWGWGGTGGAPAGTGPSPTRGGTVVLAASALVMVGGWFLFVARDVFSYLYEPFAALVGSAQTLASTSDATATTQGTSTWALGIQAAGLLLLAVLFVRSGYDAMAQRLADPWRWGLLAGGLFFFVGNAVRFLGDQGPELAGRISTFSYLPMSVIAAAVLARWVARAQLSPTDNRWLSRIQQALSGWPKASGSWAVRYLARPALVASLGVTLLMAGARVGGWPPLWGVLPGPYLPAAYERSVDAEGVSAAQWIASHLPSGSRIGGDLTALNLATTYGHADPVNESGSLYYATGWTSAQQAQVDQLAIGYLWVDLRLADSAPTSGGYFASSSNVADPGKKLTSAQLTKFDSVAGFSLIYNSGDIRIYATGEA